MDRKSRTSLAHFHLLFNNQLESQNRAQESKKGRRGAPSFGGWRFPRYFPRIWKKRMMDSIPR